jgi:hypothetical protein
LKLHVPGSPAFYAASVFRKGTETFRKGAINSHLEHLTEACYAAIRTLNQDFMHELGYDLDDEFLPGYVPRFVDKFRHRPLVLNSPVTTTAKASPPRETEGCSPNAVYAYRGYLAALTGRLYSAQPQSAPRPVDPRLETGSEHFYVAPSWEELLGMIDKDPLADRQATPRAVRDMRVDDLFQLDPIPPVQVLADVCGFNVVEFDGRFYCLEHVRGDVNVEWDDTTGIFAARTLDEARAYCEARATPAVEATSPARAA